eukprot:Gregarina_sp_Poly_1__1475@NODE_136_length_13140_cov_67_629236_g121_i0_p14_GENE_NODE_136_length_13140_cov_67_629236_g121_i0NODE_136_length_13140_cov_67_629236_g121_i0_p14_ORF_typecomplete_len114_score16_03_NODE_136_length_13140_cov_67_629236_g121_i01187512216
MFSIYCGNKIAPLILDLVSLILETIETVARGFFSHCCTDEADLQHRRLKQYQFVLENSQYIELGDSRGGFIVMGRDECCVMCITLPEIQQWNVDLNAAATVHREPLSDRLSEY